MGLTIRQAAAMCGKSRSTIHRALGNGKMSGQQGDDGTWSIDPSELARVFPWDVSGQGKRDATDTPETSIGTAEAVLAAKVEMYEAQAQRDHEAIEDLRRRLDRAEERVFALSAPQATREAPKGFLGRLMGGVWR